jgi:hypothetical protein
MLSVIAMAAAAVAVVVVVVLLLPWRRKLPWRCGCTRVR